MYVAFVDACFPLCFRLILSGYCFIMLLLFICFQGVILGAHFTVTG